MDACRWWNEATVAVVTGGSQGIGLEVCKQFGEKGLKVILTACDEKLGLAAAKALNKQGLHNNIVYHQLDVQNEQSVATFTSWLLKEHGGLDILINNAAVGGMIFDQEYFKSRNIDAVESMFKTENPEGYIIEYESAKLCLDVNYYGAKRVTKALIPLLRSSSEAARIVNVGSTFGQLYVPNIMSFCVRGTAYSARCGWGQGTAGPGGLHFSLQRTQHHELLHQRYRILAKCGWGQGTAGPPGKVRLGVCGASLQKLMILSVKCELYWEFV